MERSLLLLATVFLVLSTVTASAGSIGGGDLKWMSMSSTTLFEEEMEMDSEINRRILQSSNTYISYRALGRANTPCSRAGASYYNCRPGAQRNPYTRGCNTITNCARS